MKKSITFFAISFLLIGLLTGYSPKECNSIMVYPGKNYAIDRDIVDSTIIEDMSGDGQLNFKVILANGYEIDSISTEENNNYKNLKRSF